MRGKLILSVILGCVIATASFAATPIKVPANPYKKPDQAFNYVYNICVKKNSSDKWAEYLLGSYYEKGYGTNKDIIKAYVWYKMSVTQKYQPAVQAFETLKKEMSSDQIAQAEKAYITTRDKSVKDELNFLKTMNE